MTISGMAPWTAEEVERLLEWATKARARAEETVRLVAASQQENRAAKEQAGRRRAQRSEIDRDRLLNH